MRVKLVRTPQHTVRLRECQTGQTSLLIQHPSQALNNLTRRTPNQAAVKTPDAMHANMSRLAQTAAGCTRVRLQGTVLCCLFALRRGKCACCSSLATLAVAAPPLGPYPCFGVVVTQPTNSLTQPTVGTSKDR